MTHDTWSQSISTKRYKVLSSISDLLGAQTSGVFAQFPFPTSCYVVRCMYGGSTATVKLIEQHSHKIVKYTDKSQPRGPHSSMPK